MVKTKIAVLVSGGGTNLQALLDAQQSGCAKGWRDRFGDLQQPQGIRPHPGRPGGVPGVVCNRKELGSQAAFEAAISQALADHGAELLVLAGFYEHPQRSIYPPVAPAVLNVHPSLIPSFCGKGYYGLKVHEAALAYGVKVTGATVHFVNEIPDGGEILLQKAVEIQPGDTPEVLQRRVMEQADGNSCPRPPK